MFSPRGCCSRSIARLRTRLRRSKIARSSSPAVASKSDRMALYDRIGVGYDDPRQADPYLRSRLIHHLRPSSTGRYLDVGSGTGNYTLAMHLADVEIYGLEVSPIMLEAAKRKSTAIAWVNARAEAIPFATNIFDGATCTFVHHHSSDPAAASKKVHHLL